MAHSIVLQGQSPRQESNLHTVAYKATARPSCCEGAWGEIRESNPPKLGHNQPASPDAQSHHTVGDVGVEPTDVLVPNQVAHPGPCLRSPESESNEPLSGFNRALSPEQLSGGDPSENRTRTGWLKASPPTISRMGPTEPPLRIELSPVAYEATAPP